jgi:hypothetical protein
MLDRELNGLRMSPVPADVRQLFYHVKKAQGTDKHVHFADLMMSGISNHPYNTRMMWE